MGDLPDITQEVVEGIFSRLEDMEVHLDPNPLEYGPRRLTLKIAAARSHLAQTERVYLQVSQWLQQYRHANRSSQADFALQMQDLMTNDPEVRAGRNVKDRDAIATMKLRSEKEDIASQELTLQDLEAVMTVIKAKRADLKDTQARIRDQMKLCQEEIGLGGRWGSKPAPGVEAPDLDAAPHVDATTIRDLQAMFTGEDVEVDAPPPIPEAVTSEPSLEEGLPTQGSDNEVDEFLAALDAGKSRSPDTLDIDELLGDSFG